MEENRWQAPYLTSSKSSDFEGISLKFGLERADRGSMRGDKEEGGTIGGEMVWGEQE